MIKSLYTSFILFFCFTTLAFGQRPPAWGGGADLNDFSFGFSFSYISSYLKINKQPDWTTPFNDPETGAPLTGNATSISSPNSPGFAVGFVARYRLTDHLEARVTPSIVFADRKLIYTYNSPNPETQVIEKQINSTGFDVPLQLKLKSDRVGDLRGYLIGGVKLSQMLGRKNPDADKGLLEKTVKIDRTFASYEVGLGCDIYFEFFKLSPEIKISNSFGNMLVPENHPASYPLSGLRLHTLQFSLYFE
ncbi:outer membrane beta-barrel protein [Mucilaginibacter defluvii]|uniref:Outer membrane protein beta-barrel domain-containing protein n=1 Tax=Mucilaginibacter defluvii TaxID=1196019 RepID=A0ABP9FXK5_9SPHI